MLVVNCFKTDAWHCLLKLGHYYILVCTFEGSPIVPGPTKLKLNKADPAAVLLVSQPAISPIECWPGGARK